MDLLRQSLVERLQRRTRTIAVDVMVESLARATSHPVPADVRDEAVDACATLFGRQLALFRDTDGPTADELGYLYDRGLRSAASGVPLAVVQRSLAEGHVALNRRWWAEATPEDADTAAHLTSWGAGALRLYLAALAAGHSGALSPTGRSRMETLVVTGILAGRPDPDLARRCEVAIPESYWVLVAVHDRPATAAHPEPPRTDLPRDVLVQVEPDATVYLVPDRRAAWTMVEAVCAAHRRHRPTDGFGVAHAAGVPAVPAAVTHARWVGALARAARLSHPATLDQVLPEAALVGSPTALPHLGTLVEKLVDTPKLIETLTALYREDLDRQRTATVLGIHRRTLTYRLDRIRTLTGVDPVSARGIHVFHAALTAYHLARSPVGPAPDGR